ALVQAAGVPRAELAIFGLEMSLDVDRPLLQPAPFPERGKRETRRSVPSSGPVTRTQSLCRFLIAVRDPQRGVTIRHAAVRICSASLFLRRPPLPPRLGVRVGLGSTGEGSP